LADLRSRIIPTLRTISNYEQTTKVKIIKHVQIRFSIGQLSLPQYERLIETVLNELQSIAPQFIWIHAHGDKLTGKFVRKISAHLVKLTSPYMKLSRTNMGWHFTGTKQGLRLMLVAIQAGIRWFDTSMGGIRSPGATYVGSFNVATEEGLTVLHALGAKQKNSVKIMTRSARLLENELDADFMVGSDIWGLHRLEREKYVSQAQDHLTEIVAQWKKTLAVLKEREGVPFDSRNYENEDFVFSHHPDLSLWAMTSKHEASRTSMAHAKRKGKDLCANFIEISEGKFLVEETRPLKDELRKLLASEQISEAEALVKSYLAVQIGFLKRGLLNWNNSVDDFGVNEQGRVVLVNIGQLEDIHSYFSDGNHLLNKFVAGIGKSSEPLDKLTPFINNLKAELEIGDPVAVRKLILSIQYEHPGKPMVWLPPFKDHKPSAALSWINIFAAIFAVALFLTFNPFHVDLSVVQHAGILSTLLFASALVHEGAHALEVYLKGRKVKLETIPGGLLKGGISISGSNGVPGILASLSVSLISLLLINYLPNQKPILISLAILNIILGLSIQDLKSLPDFIKTIKNMSQVKKIILSYMLLSLVGYFVFFVSGIFSGVHSTEFKAGANLISFWCFTVLLNLMAQGMSGKKWDRQQFLRIALFAGPVMAVMSWGMMFILNYLIPSGLPMPENWLSYLESSWNIGVTAIRLLWPMVVVYVRGQIYARIVGKAGGPIMDEVFWLTRQPSLLRILYLYWAETALGIPFVAHDGFTTQMFALFYFYRISAGKFFYSNENLRKSKIFLMVVPPFALAGWLIRMGVNLYRHYYPLIPQDLRGSPKYGWLKRSMEMFSVNKIENDPSFEKVKKPAFEKWVKSGVVDQVVHPDDPSPSAVDNLPFAGQIPNSVITIAANDRDEAVILNRIQEAVKAKVIGLMIVSGNLYVRLQRSFFKMGIKLPMDSLKILALIKNLKDSHEIPMDLNVIVAGNPNGLRSRNDIDHLKEKHKRGAKTVLTQPPFFWGRTMNWLKMAEKEGLTTSMDIYMGIPLITTVKNLWIWLFVAARLGIWNPQAWIFFIWFLHGGAKESFNSNMDSNRGFFWSFWEASKFFIPFVSYDKEAMARFGQKWSLDLLSRARELKGLAGVHLMPILAWKRMNNLLIDDLYQLKRMIEDKGFEIKYPENLEKENLGELIKTLELLWNSVKDKNKETVRKLKKRRKTMRKWRKKTMKITKTCKIKTYSGFCLVVSLCYLLLPIVEIHQFIRQTI
jgi:5,10-methylenetetrahydrofolate reductase